MDGIPNDDVDLAVLVHMLTVHRDAQVSGPWLRLSSSVPGISEEDFWQSQETQDRIIVGAIHDILVLLLAFCSREPPLAAMPDQT